jgi:hypothetical protein
MHDLPFFDPTDNHMVECFWSIKSRLPRHRISFKISEAGIGIFVAQLFNSVNNVPSLLPIMFCRSGGKTGKSPIYEFGMRSVDRRSACAWRGFFCKHVKSVPYVSQRQAKEKATPSGSGLPSCLCPWLNQSRACALFISTRRRGLTGRRAVHLPAPGQTA